MAEYFDMGGYASYVWSSYGAAVVLLGGLTLYILRRNAETREALKRVTVRVDEQRRGSQR